MVRFTSPIKWSKKIYDQLEQDQGYAVPPECPEPVQYGECRVNHIRKMQIAFSWDRYIRFRKMYQIIIFK